MSLNFQGNALEHLALGGFEVEQLPEGFVRVRWAVPGPSGVVAWRQTVMQSAVLARNATRESQYARAGMAWGNFTGALTNGVVTVPASASLSEHIKGKLFGSLMQARAAAREFASFVAHGLAGFSLDPAAQGTLLNGLFALLLFSGRVRRAAYALSRALRGHDRIRPFESGSCPRHSARRRRSQGVRGVRGASMAPAFLQLFFPPRSPDLPVPSLSSSKSRWLMIILGQ